MELFFIGLVILLVGYFTYGKYVEKVFAPDEKRPVPAVKYQDGVDYVPMGTFRNGLIQLLNIAGTGPIFGPIMGALFGPIAFILIPIGNILAGAVHDYLGGMISVRNKGAHIPQLAGHFLGLPMKHLVNIFAMLLLLLLGTVFIRTPADLFVKALGGNVQYYIYGIFVYYFLSTLLPIDKIIGRIYPYLGALMVFSAVGILFGLLFLYRGNWPVMSLENLHPQGLPIVPMFFMTVTCGLLSGFHATQSPIISRTLQNEMSGRKVFYGMMVLEGIIAMTWALAAMVLFNKDGVTDIAHFGGPAGVVSQTAINIFGTVIGAVVIVGIIVLPVTSGDTAFRSLRMIIADYINLKQGPYLNRFLIVIPIFAISYGLTFVDFGVLWRYFSFANQATGTIALFISTAYLFIKGKNYWIAFIPAVFMLFVSVSYIANAKIGFNLEWHNAYIGAAAITLIITVIFLIRSSKVKKRNIKTDDVFE